MPKQTSFVRRWIRLSAPGAVVAAWVAGVGAMTRVSAQFEPPGDIILLEPITSTTRLAPSAGIGILYTYFNMVWPWVLGSAAGIAVLWSLIGGIQIMLSGDNTTMRTEGQERLLWALAGLLMIGLAGVILSTLNPLFYVQV